MEYTIIQAVVAAWPLLSLVDESSSDFTNSVANLFFYLVLTADCTSLANTWRLYVGNGMNYKR